MRRQGFTLAEVMISLALSLFMFVAAFEFLGITRRLFSKLSGAEEEIQAATAALDKMRIDFSQAGLGLAPVMRSSSMPGVEFAGQTLTLSLAEKSYALAEDVFAGQVLVPLRDGVGPRGVARGLPGRGRPRRAAHHLVVRFELRHIAGAAPGSLLKERRAAPPDRENQLFPGRIKRRFA